MNTFPRRTLLQRGLLVLGAALGFVAAERRPDAQALAEPPPESTRAAEPGTLRLYGRGPRPQAPPPLFSRTSQSEHVVGYGELLDAPNGVVIGRFCTNGLCPQTPFGHALAASPTIEFQTLALTDGTVFGVGATALTTGLEQSYAIIGGTGRFAGVAGTYNVRTTSPDSGSRAITEFTLNLTA